MTEIFSGGLPENRDSNENLRNGEEVIPTIFFESNPLLLDFVEELQTSPLDWSSIMDAAKITSAYATATAVGRFDNFITDGFLSEVYVAQVLQECSEDWEGIIPGLSIPNYYETDTFSFRRQHGSNDSWAVVDKRKGNDFITEYDQIGIFQGETVSDDLLVIFEIKLRSRKLNRVTSEKHINILLEPLRELSSENQDWLPSKFGYITISTSDPFEASADFENFIKAGGLYIPLPIDRKTFHEEAENVRKELQLKHYRKYF